MQVGRRPCRHGSTLPWFLVANVVVTLASLTVSGDTRSGSRWRPGLPEQWGDSPMSLMDFPSQVDPGTGHVTFTIDPWLYRHRLGMYRTLLRESASLHYGGDPWANPLWGLPLQLDWQRGTGRLLNEANTSRISSLSWWANVNFLLSVVPFLTAVQASVLTGPSNATWSVRILPPGGSNAPSFCGTFQECSTQFPNATLHWHTFMSRVSRGSGGGLPVAQALQLLWEGHRASLHEGMPFAEPLLAHLPSGPERDFGVGWGHLVDFVAAMQVDCNFNQTNHLQAMTVPPRMLNSSDVAPFIKDFSPEQNRSLMTIALLRDLDRRTGGLVFSLFRQVCCTAAGRADAFAAMLGFLADPVTDVGKVLAVLRDLAESHPCPSGSRGGAAATA